MFTSFRVLKTLIATAFLLWSPLGHALEQTPPESYQRHRPPNYQGQPMQWAFNEEMLRRVEEMPSADKLKEMSHEDLSKLIQDKQYLLDKTNALLNQGAKIHQEDPGVDAGQVGGAVTAGIGTVGFARDLFHYIQAQKEDEVPFSLKELRFTPFIIAGLWILYASTSSEFDEGLLDTERYRLVHISQKLNADLSILKYVLETKTATVEGVVTETKSETKPETAIKP